MIWDELDSKIYTLPNTSSTKAILFINKAKQPNHTPFLLV